LLLDLHGDRIEDCVIQQITIDQAVLRESGDADGYVKTQAHLEQHVDLARQADGLIAIGLRQADHQVIATPGDGVTAVDGGHDDLGDTHLEVAFLEGRFQVEAIGDVLLHLLQPFDPQGDEPHRPVEAAGAEQLVVDFLFALSLREHA